MSEEEVTADDFIMPEFRNAKPSDYERRHDGKIVRKDRWETGVRSIATIIGMGGRSEYEIPQVVERVRQLVSHELAAWQEIDYNNPATLPIEGRLCLVDWDCFGDDSVNPRVLVWLRNKNTAEPAEPLEGFIWACPDRKEWAGYGLDLPNPTHFKYVGIRPEVASVEDD